MATYPQKGEKNTKSQIAALTRGILANDLPSLSRAITLVESTKKEHQEIAQAILQQCIDLNRDTIRIGITGIPGVGKSTFIERFGKLLTGMGKKLAVLTVDPTSSRSKGSILGDKTRMQELVADPNAFIRPSPSGSSLGGVTRKTRESIILLEAAGYDTIIVETVGVGQSETAVYDMVDFFVLLKIAGAGDELQGIKRGIMEMAHAIVINKADGINVKKSEQAAIAFERAVALFPPKENGWIPKVMHCSALENTGIEPIWDCISLYMTEALASGYKNQNRREQQKKWLYQYMEQRITDHFYQDKKIKALLPKYEEKVLQGITSPFVAAEALLQSYFIDKTT
jgi:LAO/AO transport system kinase